MRCLLDSSRHISWVKRLSLWDRCFPLISSHVPIYIKCYWELGTPTNKTCSLGQVRVEESGMYPLLGHLQHKSSLFYYLHLQLPCSFLKCSSPPPTFLCCYCQFSNYSLAKITPIHSFFWNRIDRKEEKQMLFLQFLNFPEVHHIETWSETFILSKNRLIVMTQWQNYCIRNTIPYHFLSSHTVKCNHWKRSWYFFPTKTYFCVIYQL